tara:strand:- start:4441 stop:4602 length:162 start_codon:yes stop_codon:yes gene_type:complete
MNVKSSWWKLSVFDYPNYEPNEIDLEHIAEMIKQGYTQGELIQEEEAEKDQDE